jgi:hypothetical protein
MRWATLEGMATCHHGYEQDQCLICQALGLTTTATAGQGEATRRRWLPGRGGTATAPVARPVATPAVRPRRPAATLALIAVVAVAALLAVWVVIGAVFAILRIVEIVAVAVAAGWVGYRVGHWRGRHER